MLEFAHGAASTHGGHRNASTRHLLAPYRIMRCAAPAGEVHICI
jgi:hypothetical protein